ncbi:MAG TPA: hypothetical protein DDX39_00985 [Bacteroidales bacterium]|nr:MAG: hypothetical protein A2W98_06570 [Bacteroidetes bacterium GWF2_33_38]OFY75017.1 MAG: hypothetical protein A2265_11985 [Bacteroidetes bacterium RIFOXYA12_FULL_33_9]OFY88075.1 MAG: hypothetical protein A2236_00335 [Bacteroidetes bacterium RIFOXYA2_FULL_33_7]HBF87186.1 hypothetical protein [Bacteroidales bacterium]
MSKKKTILVKILISIIATFILLHFVGDTTEKSIRHFYREKICNCDTLRFKEFNDSLGVPFINYFSITGKHIGVQRNPTSICFAADKYFNDIEKNENKTKFTNCVNWLLKNGIRKDSCLFYEYNFDWVYHTKAPWRSAMAQGLAIKTFTQAFQIFRDSVYLQKIDSILNSFLLEVDSGGITYKESINKWWYEEYSCKNSSKPHVLNGMMYALHGLYYNYQHTKNECALEFFNKGINSLKSNIPIYDNVNERSFYDLKGKVADEYYHQIHVDFLKEFYKITHEKTFLNYYNKWSSISPENYLFKTISNPSKSAILIFIIIFTIIYLLISLTKRF